MSAFPMRKQMRLQSFDYNEAFQVFLTICTKERRCVLSRIVGNGLGSDGTDDIRVELTSQGKIAEEVIQRMDSFYEHISVDEYVIMPNHIHLLVSFTEKNNPHSLDGPPVPTKASIQNSETAKFVSSFKRFCNKVYGDNIWQYRSFDHIIRDNDDLAKHVKYILENPAKWHMDKLFIE